jgi:hypothetical protein
MRDRTGHLALRRANDRGDDEAGVEYDAERVGHAHISAGSAGVALGAERIEFTRVAIVSEASWLL